MAAPTPTTRIAPSGSSRRIPEGYRTLVTFALHPSVALYEKSVKPGGVDGGEPIDISSQFNDRWIPFHPRTLIKMDPITFEAGYDPDTLPTIRGMVNTPDTITVLYPDGSTDAFYGWLQKFELTDLKMGEYPMGNFTIFPSNTDATTFAEQGPVFTPASGT